MYKRKLGLGLLNPVFAKTTLEDQIRILHNAGFEAFFTEFDKNEETYRKIADELGMIYQSIHAPFGKCNQLWHPGAETEHMMSRLLECVDACVKVNVPIMILHTYIGFEPSAGPTAAGIENYRKIIEYAAQNNVKIALENTEGEEYLAALMDAFKSYENVGFCWDTGHELCYNKSRDMMALYGDRLIATHLNDNLGIRDFDGAITCVDDLHLLPFDGVTDWDSVARRLNQYGFDDILTFEMTLKNKKDRHDLDKYQNMSFESYVAEVYARACRVATLMNKGR